MILEILVTIVVSLLSISLGTMVGYPTKALPQLQSEPNNALKLTENEGSGFAAILTLSGVIFSPLIGFLSGWLSRKKENHIFYNPNSCIWMVNTCFGKK